MSGLQNLAAGFIAAGTIFGMQDAGAGYNIGTYRTGVYANVIADQTFTSGASLSSADDDTLYLRCTFNNSVGEADASHCVFLSGCTKITFRDCEIDASNHSSGSVNGFRLSNSNSCTDIRVENGDIHDCAGTGVFPGAGVGSTVPNHPGFKVFWCDIYETGTSGNNHGIYSEANGSVIVGNHIYNNKGGNPFSIRCNAYVAHNRAEINSRPDNQPGVGFRAPFSTWDSDPAEDLVFRKNVCDFRTINKDQANTSAYFMQAGGKILPNEILLTDNETITFPGDADDHVLLEGAGVISITTESGNFVTQTAGDTEILSQSEANSSTNVTSQIYTAPSGIEDGDELVIIQASDGDISAEFTWPSGFAEIAAVAATASGPTLGIATKTASSESGNYTNSWTTAERVAGLMLRCRAGSVAWVDDTDAVAVTSHTIPAVTPSEVGDTILIIGTSDNSTAVMTVDEAENVADVLDGNTSSGFGASLVVDMRYMTIVTPTSGFTLAMVASLASARGTLLLRP